MHGHVFMMSWEDFDAYFHSFLTHFVARGSVTVRIVVPFGNICYESIVCSSIGTCVSSPN